MSDEHMVRPGKIPTRLEESEDGYARITPEHTIADVLRYLIRTNNYNDVLNTLLMLGRENFAPFEADGYITIQNVYPESPESVDTMTIWSSDDEN